MNTLSKQIDFGPDGTDDMDRECDAAVNMQGCNIFDVSPSKHQALNGLTQPEITVRHHNHACLVYVASDFLP